MRKLFGKFVTSLGFDRGLIRSRHRLAVNWATKALRLISIDCIVAQLIGPGSDPRRVANERILNYVNHINHIYRRWLGYGIFTHRISYWIRFHNLQANVPSPPLPNNYQLFYLLRPLIFIEIHLVNNIKSVLPFFSQL